MMVRDDNKGDDSGSNDARDERPDNKVARLIDAYGLGETFGERLEERWTAEGEERESLRALADRFNERILKAAMTDAGMSTLDGEVSNLYRLLTDDGVSSGNQIEACRRLERNGVDIDRLEDDLVSYQAIRSYLQDYRDAEYHGGSGGTRVESVTDTVRRLQSRVQSVSEKSLAQLRKTGRLRLGTFRLFVKVDVLCEDCGNQYGILELLEEGGCECDAQ